MWFISLALSSKITFTSSALKSDKLPFTEVLRALNAEKVMTNPVVEIILF